MFEYLALFSVVIVLLQLLRRRSYNLFFIILLTTEFFYIPVGEGFARIYHFLAVLVVLSLAGSISRLFSSRVFIALLIFFGVNLCAVILSESPDRAFGSLLSLAANLGVVMATALILLTRSVGLTSFKRIVIWVTLISVVWGLFQIVVYRLTGTVLALSPKQESQIIGGFGPGFRTEANTFGKYMVFPFLLFLPEYIAYRVKHFNWILLIFLVGIMMNFTRTAIYGMGFATIFIVIWFVRQGKVVLLTRRSVKLGVVIAVVVTLIVGGYISVSDYARYKVEKLFTREEILEGGSGAYRLNMMKVVFDDVMSDSKKMLIGNGWGQTRVYFQNVEVQAGGGDFINVLGYSGLIGLCGYLAYMLIAFRAAAKVARTKHVGDEARFAEGVMFALVGVFCASQMAGYLIAPEYWMMIGLCIYLEDNKTLQANVQAGSY